jgi:hypothetical protein
MIGNVSNEAKLLATELLASFPGRAIAEINILALADTFERMGMDIAPAVAEQAREDFERPPSSAQLYGIAREIRAAEIEREHWMRPTLEAAAALAMPLEIVEKVKVMIDPERRRREREDEITAQDAEWARKKAAARHGARMAGTCNGTGKIPIEREDGTHVCPDCGTEILDISAEPLPKPRRRHSWRTGEVV